MSFKKENNYPNPDKPGIYHNVDDKLNGLDNDNLEKFSLGNWNSIIRNNKKFPTSDLYNISELSPLGRPVRVTIEGLGKMFEDVSTRNFPLLWQVIDTIEGKTLSEIELGRRYAGEPNGALSGEQNNPNFTIKSNDSYRNDGDLLPLVMEINHRHLGYVTEDGNSSDVFATGNFAPGSHKVDYYSDSVYFPHFFGASSDEYWGMEDSDGTFVLGRNSFAEESYIHCNDTGNPLMGLFKSKEAIEDVKSQLYDKLTSLKNLLHNSIAYLSVDAEDDVVLRFDESTTNQLNEILTPVIADYATIIPFRFAHYYGARQDPSVTISNNGFIIGGDGDGFRVFDDHNGRFKHVFSIPFQRFEGALDYYGVRFYEAAANTGTDSLNHISQFEYPLWGLTTNVTTGAQNADVCINFATTNPNQTNQTKAGLHRRQQLSLICCNPVEEFTYDDGGNLKPDNRTTSIFDEGLIQGVDSQDNINISEIHFLKGNISDDAVMDELGVNNDFVLTLPEFDLDVVDAPEPVDYIVSVFHNKDLVLGIDDDLNKSTISSIDSATSNSFLFYGKDGSDYINTSFPIKVYLGVNLHTYPTFQNNLSVAESNYEWLNIFYRDDVHDYFSSVFQNESAVEGGYYKYKVIQWGDEESLLSDDEILNSYHFINYDVDVDPSGGDYNLRMQQQEKTFPIIKNDNTILTSHTYTTPGVKEIKIIIQRYLLFGRVLNETTLVTKNIIINDGNLSVQDFEVFGGTDFNFLPIRDSQVIVGGIDEDSKYINSSKKIENDDSYDRDDILSKNSNIDFIKKYEDGVFGKNPDKIDLGNLRTFRGVKRLNQHIGNFHINSGSVDNSLISNIFIDKIDSELKDDTTLELNPQKRDFTSLQNTVGTEANAILIGDYELEKKNEDTPISKKGIMNKPQIENNKIKQAI